MWFIYAILAAVFASLMSITMKIALKDIDTMLASTIRTSVVFILGWIYVFFNKTTFQITNITRKNWLFLMIAGIVTFGTWSCFFMALKYGNVAKVLAVDRLSIILTIIIAAIFLKETITIKAVLGIALTLIGVVLVIF